MDTYDKIQNEMDELLGDTELQFTEASLMDKKRVELIELCKEHGLPSYGTKQQLTARLMEEFGDDSVLEATSKIVVVQEERVSAEDGESLGTGKRV